MALAFALGHRFLPFAGHRILGGLLCHIETGFCEDGASKAAEKFRTSNTCPNVRLWLLADVWLRCDLRPLYPRKRTLLVGA